MQISHYQLMNMLKKFKITSQSSQKLAQQHLSILHLLQTYTSHQLWPYNLVFNNWSIQQKLVNQRQHQILLFLKNHKNNIVKDLQEWHFKIWKKSISTWKKNKNNLEIHVNRNHFLLPPKAKADGKTSLTSLIQTFKTKKKISKPK